MADTSIGFDVQNGINETDWANLAPFTGNRLPVVSQVNTKRVVAGAQAMTVDVQTGISAAFGARHDRTTVTNLPIAPVTLSGASRWDAVVVRYDWSSNTVTPLVVPGNASVGATEVAPTLNSSAGTIFDQLLALVKAVNGSNALTISDKRLWASPFYTAATLGALPAAAGVPYGTVVYVVDTKTIYRCLLSNGSLAWVPDSDGITELTGSAVLKTVQSGWAADGTHVNRCLVQPYSRQIDLEFRRSGAEINAANSDGNFSDTPVVVLQDTCKPDRPMPVRIDYITSDGKEFGGDARLDPDGTLMLLGGAVARNLAQSTAVGTVSLRASIRFDRRTA